MLKGRIVRIVLAARLQESSVLQYPIASNLLLSGVLVAFLCLTGCEEDVAGPSGVDAPFSMYGILNPELRTQTVLVAPVEDLLVPESGGALDAVVTSTDLGSGTTYAWRDSVVANATGQLDHIYWADFTPEYGSRHRVEAARSDGLQSSVEVNIPEPVRIDENDPGSRILTVNVSAPSDFSLIRVDAIYGVRFYDKFEPGTPCSTPVKHYAFPYKGAEIKTNDGWRIKLNLFIHYETMRSYYHDDVLADIDDLRFRNPSTDGLALMSLKLDLTVGNPEWNLPEGVSIPNALGHPNILSNVENGYGFVGGGYDEDAPIYPSYRAIRDTPFFDFMQRAGGDYCLGTIEDSEG